MSRVAGIVLVAAMAATLGGCGRRAEQPEEEQSVDPAGDLAKLQGRWTRVPQGEGPLKWPESYLTIDGNTATYDHPTLRASGQGGDIFRYRFVLNSAGDPKTMLFTHEIREGHEVALLRTHKEYNKRYKLEEDTLTIWTYWNEIEPKPLIVYKRDNK